MSVRKYPLTMSEADIVVLALNEAIRFVKDVDPDGAIPFGDFYVKSAFDLLNKLKNYTWEVEK